MRRLLLVLFSSTLLVSPLSVVSAAEVSGRQKRILEVINSTVRQAAVSFQGQRFDESAESIRRALKQIDAAMNVATPEMFDAMQPAMDHIVTTHALLELEGFTLPPFRRPSRPESSGSASVATTNEAMATGTPPGSQPADSAAVSFTQNVAPILVAKCGDCHIEESRGRFTMNTFAALMKGPPEGVVIFPGDVIASRLIETIETGDMPRGGLKVTPEELQTLKNWVVAGAKFDGDDPNAPLTAMAAGSSPTTSSQPTAPEPPAMPAVTMASGDETVSFAADIAPLLVDNCSGCHIDAMQNRGGLSMQTFAQLMRGGDSGPIVVPGSGEQSLLVQKLRGSVGARMPAGGRPALSEESIQLIATWIDEGASLDGASADQPLSVMSQLAWVASASPAEVSQRRKRLAEEHLRLGAGAQASVNETSTDHFLVIGTSSPGTLDLVAQQAQSAMQEVVKTVDGQSGEGFFGGRATIFVLPGRYAYSEFTRMVEARSVPADWDAHWRFDGVDAYVAVVAEEAADPESIHSRLLAPLTSLAVATRGPDVPRWFAEGVGTTIAARAGGPSDREARQRLQAETAEAVAAMPAAKDFLDGKMTPEHTDRIGAGVVASMMDRTRRRSFDKLMRLLSEGTPFEAAFTQSFGITPTGYLDAWRNFVRRG